MYQLYRIVISSWLPLFLWLFSQRFCGITNALSFMLGTQVYEQQYSQTPLWELKILLRVY